MLLLGTALLLPCVLEQPYGTLQGVTAHSFFLHHTHLLLGHSSTPLLQARTTPSPSPRSLFAPLSYVAARPDVILASSTVSQCPALAAGWSCRHCSASRKHSCPLPHARHNRPCSRSHRVSWWHCLRAKSRSCDRNCSTVVTPRSLPSVQRGGAVTPAQPVANITPEVITAARNSSHLEYCITAPSDRSTLLSSYSAPLLARPCAAKLPPRGTGVTSLLCHGTVFPHRCAARAAFSSSGLCSTAEPPRATGCFPAAASPTRGADGSLPQDDALAPTKASSRSPAFSNSCNAQLQNSPMS